MADVYEIEVKSLVGDSQKAEEFRARLMGKDPACTIRSSHTQLNHYFEGGDITLLAENIAPHVSEDTKEKIARIVKEGSSISLRTREADGVVKIVIKASLGSDSSANGVVRLELEEPVSMSLTDLDELIMSAGYSYQAKWSRTREEYVSGPFSICLDKNAGYGYVVEVERVITSKEETQAARDEIFSFMKEIGIEELPQDRLERMFAYYNAHWPEYYGTDRVFTIE